MPLDMNQIVVIAPNLKRRLSGVTATIARLVPVQARDIGIVATGPGLPPDIPRIPLWRTAVLPRDRWRVWHARRNTEMLFGLVLRYVLRRRVRLIFTSASQRRHTGYTKWLIARMDALIATSRKTAAFLDRPATVILHGIDTDSFHPAADRPALRRRLGLPESALIVGCFGRIRAQKGTGDFVDAIVPLLADRPRLLAIVMGRATAGHADFLAALQRGIAAASHPDRLRILPEVPVADIPGWYAALDLFVAPQRWEGFGLTPLEAMAAGVPVVATRAGAFDELVLDGVTGQIVAASDPAALSRAVARFIDDADLRKTAGRAARDHVVSHHRIEDEAAAITAVYRRQLADTGVTG